MGETLPLLVSLVGDHKIYHPDCVIYGNERGHSKQLYHDSRHKLRLSEANQTIWSAESYQNT